MSLGKDHHNPKPKEIHMKTVDVKEFAKETGGLVLSSQKVKVHSNGAKITISKVYITHGLIKPEQTYTVILVPEEDDRGDD